MKLSLKKEEWLLMGIMAAATIVRFYHFDDLPLTFDEFSALSRTHFDNFRDLIHYGVVTSDTHPAGVQVFMYYWVKLFGDGSMAVKLPFMIAGVASIYFTYRIAEQWFNPTTGIVAALFISFLQYPVYLTQMARPYASGLLLSVLLVWWFSKGFVFCNSKCIRYRIGFTVVAALCAYNHYFTLFFAGVVGITGIFVISAKQIKAYLLCLVIAMILFLPHLEIFFIQLGKGGVESWLAKPQPGFFLEYLKFILHFHPLLYVVSGILFLVSFVFPATKISRSNRFRWLILSWLIITYATSYLYSVYVNAVLQYSVLLFTFPFLVMFTFSFIRQIKFKYNIVIVVVFGVSALYSLTYGRQHYAVFYDSGHREILELAESKLTSLGKDNVTVLTDLPPNINDYYFRKMDINRSEYIQLDEMDGYIGLKNFLKNEDSRYLVLGWYDQKQINYLNVALDYYPYIIEEKNWFLCTYYFLSKNEPEKYIPAEKIVYSYTADTAQNSWPVRMDESDLYFSLFESPLSKIVKNDYNNLFFTLSASVDQLDKEAVVVTEFRQNDSIVNWRSVSLLDFIDTVQTPINIHEGIKLIDLRLDVKATEVRIYCWNKGGARMELHNFELVVRHGNPILYSLYYDF